MPRTSDTISQQIRAQLKILIPDLSLDPNTPERKLVDTVSDVVADASIDQYVIDYQYDIDTKVGADLDKFVALFGFARQSGKRASGRVTFSRATEADIDIYIAAGTQITKPPSSISGLVTYFTTASVVLPAGALSVDAPIEAADIGPLGNVPANTITQFGTGNLTSVSEVKNNIATTGGANDETDAELRVRFKNTIFRNIAGTRDQYLALAIASRFTNKANVIGPISRFIEYVQVEPDLVVLSEIPYSQWTYNVDYYLTNGEFTNEIFYAPNGVDYTFDDTVPPSITINSAGSLNVNDVVLLEHSYCSANSRNDPANNIGNYVDVYVSGQDIIEAEEALRFPSSANNFVGTVGNAFENTRWIRYDTGSNPVIGNRFQELLWQPIFTLPSSITINSIEFFLGTHYWLVVDRTNVKGSRRARNGIEWSSTAAASIPTGTIFVLNYDFNRLPISLNELMEKHKQVTTDVLVHSATERFYNINLIVMYTPGLSRTSVDEAVSATLTDFLEKQQFGAVIQISDILEIAHSVPGVDNVRLALPGDGVAYGIQEVAGNGTTPLGVPFVDDFAIQDSDLPVLHTVVTTQKSQNTW
jgi:uncharacterized phage protein gp47/JayE